MIYTSTQGGEARFFPDYFSLPNERRLHPVPSQIDRLADGFREISYQPARSQADLMGAVVAGWADMGLHTETFWLGYATITAAAWHPGSPSTQGVRLGFLPPVLWRRRGEHGSCVPTDEPAIALLARQLGVGSVASQADLRLFVWHLQSQAAAQGSGDRASARAGTRFAVRRFLDAEKRTKTCRFPAVFLAENDELLGLLQENLRTANLNRYNLEVYVSIAQLYRQNLEMLRDLGRINYLLESAQKAAEGKDAKQAVEHIDRALQLAKLIRQQRNTALRDATATWEQSWFPRVAKANGRTFLHDLDDVKDHVPDRTVDMSYLVAARTGPAVWRVGRGDPARRAINTRGRTESRSTARRSTGSIWATIPWSLAFRENSPK